MKAILYIYASLCLLLAISPVTSLFAAPGTAVVAARDVSFYTAVTRFLQEHVQEGQLNYKALQKDQGQLQRLVQQLAVYNLENAPASERKAFYLNAYNLLVLHQVLAHYPLKSVKDVPGFFDERQFRVAGEMLTLNQLEKQKLMAPYRDARVHFALVCAARSCPPLLNEAYAPGKVEEQLEAQTKRALQDDGFIKVQPKGKKVLVSELFKWYREDFLRHAPSVPAYINRYRSHPLPAGYTLGYYPYNWALNDTGR
ncbi:hypothetical protein GCM10023188_33110 [Pontibacter saemangeumensis]|uniref:DUF547 domain-containing protein n=1 Tax=Pontibacter saemangeumensis TaxID=1084525 RepID=A0ABP8LYE7_9BACT